MKSSAYHAVLICIVVTTLASRAYASTVQVKSVAELARLADDVFAGTVQSVTYKPDSMFGGLTSVTFGKLRWAKGRKTAQITVSLRGGRLGAYHAVIDGLPEFETGRRYILFVDGSLGSKRNSYNPIYGLHQGVYEVRKDVLGYSERPVIAVVDGKALLLDKRIGRDGARKYTAKPVHGASLPARGTNPKALDPPAPIVSDPEPSSLGIPESARLLGARAREGGWLLVPEALDPGTRISEDGFLTAVSDAAR